MIAFTILGEPASKANSRKLALVGKEEEEKRILFDVYFYIQPRPMGLFDGFHLISADIKSCMGYPLTKAP